jgi:hypothetical protein
MMVAHRWYEPRNVSSARPPTAARAHLVADHRFSEEELAGLLSALRARAEAHPDNPGLVAYWPAVPAERMAAACGLLASRGHSVQPVTVALWDRERTRDGWTLGTAPHDVTPTPDLVAFSDTDRWTNEGGRLEAVSSAEFTTERTARDSADATRADSGLPEPGR